MPSLPWEVIQANAVAFSERWKDAHNEEAQGQAFLLDFFKVFGLADPVLIKLYGSSTGMP